MATPRIRTLPALLAALASQASAAPATAPPEAKPIVLYEVKQQKSLFTFDYGPPTSPALSLTGQSPDKTTTSTSLGKFALTIPSLYGEDGDKAIAFDVAPASLFEHPSRATYKAYMNGGRAYRLGYRTRLGVAAMNGKDGDGDASKAVRSRLALGLSSSLLDSADPLRTGWSRATNNTFLDRCLADYLPVAYQIQQKYASAPAEALQISKELERAVDARDKLIDGASPEVAWTIWKQARPEEAETPAAAPAPQPAKVQPVDQHMAELKTVFDRLDKDPGASADQKAFNRLAMSVLADIANRDRPPAPAAPATAPAAPTASNAPAGLTREALLEDLSARIVDLTAQLKKPAEANDKELNTRLKAAGVTAAASRCSDGAARLARFSPDLDIGFGAIARGDPGRLDGLDKAGGAVWLGYKMPLGQVLFRTPKPDAEAADQVPLDAWMVVISGRYAWNDWRTTGDKAVTEFPADVTEAWVGLERLTEATRWAVQYGWSDVSSRNLAGKPFEQSGERYMVSGQFRVGDESSPIWLGLSYGNAYGSNAKLHDNTALVTLSVSPPKPPDLTGGK